MSSKTPTAKQISWISIVPQLISSAKTKYEIRKSIRLFGKTNLISVIPYNFFNPPRFFANYLFGTANKELLNEILDDTDFEFAKWSITKLINWSNIEVPKSVIKISGTKDKLIPKIIKDDAILIEKGEHFMIVDRAKEVSKIINEEIKKRHHNIGYHIRLDKKL